MKKAINKNLLICAISLLVVTLVTALAVTTYAVWVEQTEDFKDVEIDQPEFNPSLKYIVFKGMDVNGAFTDDETLITAYAAVGYTSGLVKELVIPETYNEKPVTRISALADVSFEYSFKDNQIISSLRIPASVVTIDDGVFAGAIALRTVTFDKSEDGSASELNIGVGAFAGCISLEAFQTNGRTIVGENYLFGTPLE